MRCVLPPAPLDLIDLFFYLQRFQVVEFRLVRLKLGMEFVLACFLLLSVRSSLRLFVLKAMVQGGGSRHSQSHSSRKGPLDLLCRPSLDNCQCDRTPPSILYPLSDNVSKVGPPQPRTTASLPSVISSTSPLSPKHLTPGFSQCPYSVNHASSRSRSSIPCICEGGTQ